MPTLYLLCGKIAAGKSTLARQLASRPATLLISEDHWTSHLFADDLKTIEDYGRLSARLRAAIGPRGDAAGALNQIRLVAEARRVPTVDSTLASFHLSWFPSTLVNENGTQGA